MSPRRSWSDGTRFPVGTISSAEERVEDLVSPYLQSLVSLHLHFFACQVFRRRQMLRSGRFLE
jgi:hypothetical protein